MSIAIALTLLAASCGDDEPPPAPAADPEQAWRELLAESDLEPARDAVRVTVRGGAPELEVTIASEAAGELTFADGLYGALAYAFDGEAWERVDTAEIRTQVAPLLGPGEEARLSLPVREADSYRVLVPVEGRAAWGESG